MKIAHRPQALARLEATASDPDVQQQNGMTVGTPDANQIWLRSLAEANARPFPGTERAVQRRLASP